MGHEPAKTAPSIPYVPAIDVATLDKSLNGADATTGAGMTIQRRAAARESERDGEIAAHGVPRWRQGE